MSRRAFVSLPGALAGSVAAMAPGDGWDPAKPFERRQKTLRVRPVLLYATPAPKKQTSWKSWGGVQTEAAATEELARITGEWAALKKKAEFPLDVLPACLLLRAVSGRPVFMHNSTFPHNGVVTCAHCAAPRRMDGAKYEPVRILTHYESEYGASPKVEIPVGQEVTFVDPEYATCRWVGIRGVVEANPFLPICRSQQDVRIQGDWKKLLNEARDSHWAMAYGDWLKECGYAAERVGVKWERVS